MKTISGLLILLFSFSFCTRQEKTIDLQKLKTEIINTENAFMKMAQNEGIAAAFEYFAADDAVLLRNQQLVKSKDSISSWYKARVTPEQSLSWEPDFVDVSQSGDMAYTYGQYTFSYPDSTGTLIKNSGIFHTVWKQQKDGSWKFVWD